MFEIDNNLSFNTCLLPMITETSHYFINAYRRYNKGVLEWPGSWQQQPNAYIDAMELIDVKQ